MPLLGAAVLIVSVPPARPKVGLPQIEYWSCVYIGPLILSPEIKEIVPQLEERPLRSRAPHCW